MRSLWIIASAALIYLLQSFLYAKYWKKGLKVHLEFTQGAICEGELGELKEVVQNRKRLPLPFLQVDLQSHRSFQFVDQTNTAVSDQVYRRDIYSLLPYQQITRTLAFVGTKRGYYPCREVELVGRTLFFEGPFVDKQPQDTALYVYPKAIGAEQVEMACQEMLGEYQWEKKLFEDPFSFKGIRDYGPGDSFRQVNWKAFARTGELKVNVYEHTAMARAQILLNVRGDQIWTEEVLQEGGVRIAAAMAKQWIGMGVPVGIRTNGRDVCTGWQILVEPGAGPDHVTRILQALSRIDLIGQGRAGRAWAEGSGAWAAAGPAVSAGPGPTAGPAVPAGPGPTAGPAVPAGPGPTAGPAVPAGSGPTAGPAVSAEPGPTAGPAVPAGSDRTAGPGGSALSGTAVREDGWLWEGVEEGGRPGEGGGLLLYIAAGSRDEDLAQLERIRQSGAVVRWIRPYTWRQEEQYRRAGLERTAGQEQIDAGKGQPQAIYRGQIIEWRLEG